PGLERIGEIGGGIVVAAADRQSRVAHFRRTPARIDFEQWLAHRVMVILVPGPVLGGPPRMMGYGEIGFARRIEERPKLTQMDGRRDAPHVLAVEPEIGGLIDPEINVVVAAESLGMRAFEGQERNETAGRMVVSGGALQ